MRQDAVSSSDQVDGAIRGAVQRPRGEITRTRVNGRDDSSLMTWQVHAEEAYEQRYVLYALQEIAQRRLPCTAHVHSIGV